MLVNAIENATRRLGKSQGFIGLPVLDMSTPHGPVMVSSWQPTPAELARLATGASLYLYVYGTSHPPVMLAVGEGPEEPPHA